MTRAISKQDLAAKIDHTILKAEATAADVDRVVDEAVEHGFAAVCVNGVFLKKVADRLSASGLDDPPEACAVAGFPLGAMKPTVQAIEATALAKDGATEVDFVAHLPTLLARDEDAARAEFVELVKAVRGVSSRVVVKVILETAALLAGVSDDEGEARVACGCRAARESGCDFVKTSTGFHPAGGASVEAVRWMKEHAGPLRVKASGGIRTYDDAVEMLGAGADRLGCSASVGIVAGAG